MSASTIPICRVSTFETSLGWMALVADGATICQLTLAHRSENAAIGAIRATSVGHARPTRAEGELIDRIRAYLRGSRDDFADVELDTSYLTPLGRAVFDRCRHIPHGETRTYGQLAAEVGRPRAARAVGQFMASNRTPILMPCHRVVAAGGGLGGFSSPGGVAVKRRLLGIERKG